MCFTFSAYMVCLWHRLLFWMRIVACGSKSMPILLMSLEKAWNRYTLTELRFLER
jgi:hypothetical protein